MGKNLGKKNVIPTISAEVGAGDVVKGFVRLPDGRIISEAQAAQWAAIAATAIANREARLLAEEEAAREALENVAMFAGSSVLDGVLPIEKF